MKKRNISWSAAVAVFIGCVWCGNAGAELIYKGDFSTYTAGDDITVNATGDDNTASAITAQSSDSQLTGSFKAFDGSASGMADGLSLKMEALTLGVAGTLTFTQTKLGSYADGTTVVVSFDAYANGDYTSGGDLRATFLKPTGGPIGTTAVGTTANGILKNKIRFTMVMNQSGSAITLPGTLGSLTDNMIAMYAQIDGSSSHISLINEAVTEGTEVGGFRIPSTMRSVGGFALLDNLGVWTSASDTVGGQSVLGLEFGTVIPEPATVGLFGISGLSVLLARRVFTR